MAHNATLRRALMGASALTASIFVMAAAGEATAQSIVLGSAAGSNETGVVGAGQTVTPYAVTLGDRGRGHLTVRPGATLGATANIVLGSNAAGEGVLDVDGVGTRVNAGGNLYVGYAGRGDLTVTGGAAVSSRADMIIGRGQGFARVDGVGSLLSTNGWLQVGFVGRGELSILNGASARGSTIMIGSYGGNGLVVVDGAGSTMTAREAIVVGRDSQGELNVTGGATATAGTDVQIAELAGSTGTATVTGAGSTLTAGRDLFVGNAGAGTLTVSAGGTASAVGEIRIGNQNGSTGTATITGAGSSLAAGSSLLVGVGGSGTLTVSAGGSARGGTVLVGDRAGSTGSVIVTGAGSSLTATGNLELGGFTGGSGDLTVSNGGAVTARVVVVGNADTGTALVDGAGSSLTATDFLVVGGTTASGTLTVSGGGSVTTRGMMIGELAGGPGSVTVTGAGLSLNATGGIILGADAGSQGTLTMGAASGAPATAAGTVNGNITFGPGDGLLAFNHNTAGYGYTGTITGAANGRILFEAGQTTFNTTGTGFSGVSDIRSGAILNLNGSLGGTMNVLAGGELRGVGRVGALNNAGVLNIGGAGALGVLNGTSASFASGSTIAVDFSGAAADHLILTGAANIASGSILSVNRPTGAVWRAGDRATFLTATGGLTGRFTLQNNAPLTNFLSLRDGYTANSAYLEVFVARNFAAAALTANQSGAAAGIQSIGSGTLFNTIANMPTDAAAQVAFDALSGELHPGVRTIAARDGYRLQQAVLRNGSAADARDGGARAWGEVWVNRGTADGDGNAAELDHETAGFIGGADVHIGGGWRLGAALGYDRGEVESGRSQGTADLLRRSVLAYLDGRLGGFDLNGGVGYTDLGVKTRRVAAFAAPTGAFRETLRGDYDGSVTHAWADVSYPVAVGQAQVAPFVSVSRVAVNTDAHTETGGMSALIVREADTDLTFSTLGLRVDRMTFAGAEITASAGWRHASGDRDGMGLHAFNGGTDFQTFGPAIGHSAAVVDLAAEWKADNNFSIGAGATFIGGDGGADGGARLSLRYSF